MSAPVRAPFFDPFNGNGSILSQAPDKVVWYWEDENGNTMTCTQTIVDPVLEANKRAYNESHGKRWGDGQIVASIPLPIYFDKIVPASLAGDDAYVKRFLNDVDNRKFRTFKGRI